MKVSVTMISTNLVANSLLTLFCPFVKTDCSLTLIYDLTLKITLYNIFNTRVCNITSETAFKTE